MHFYGWSLVDDFFRAWRHAGFRSVGHIVWVKDDASRTRFLRYRHEQAFLLAKGRPSLPYNARQSFVSWNLMLGKNLLWVAKQHGHSVQTMLDVYAAWIDGSQEQDIEAIRRAMETRPALPTGPSQGWSSTPTVPSRPKAALVLDWHWRHATNA